MPTKNWDRSGVRAERVSKKCRGGRGEENVIETNVGREKERESERLLIRKV